MTWKSWQTRQGEPGPICDYCHTPTSAGLLRIEDGNIICDACLIARIERGADPDDAA